MAQGKRLGKPVLAIIIGTVRIDCQAWPGMRYCGNVDEKKWAVVGLNLFVRLYPGRCPDLGVGQGVDPLWCRTEGQ